MSEEQKPTGAELSAEDLDQVAGGAVDMFLTLDGIKGESKDDDRPKSKL